MWETAVQPCFEEDGTRTNGFFQEAGVIEDEKARARTLMFIRMQGKVGWSNSKYYLQRYTIGNQITVHDMDSYWRNVGPLLR